MLINKLIDNKCINIGNYVLKNGNNSKYYFDMRNLISNPSLTKEIGDMLYSIMGDFDIICGIPLGALPIASYISTQYNKPLIYIRDKIKNYGTMKEIEGNYSINDKCVILDDVMTSGKSLESAYQTLIDKVIITKCVVILDRQQKEDLKINVPIVSLINKTDIVKQKLIEIQEEKKTKLCFSADITDIVKLKKIINEIGKYIVICKIHYDIIPHNIKEEFKNELINLSIKHNFLIMEDRKFNDISHIVKMQYRDFKSWVDLVTVHALVTKEVIESLSGAVIVANMSNNNYDCTEKALELSKYKDNVVGFVTQRRISNELINMTPGISYCQTKIDDQNHRRKDEVDTDVVIVGRGIYNSENLSEDIKNYI